MLIIFTFPIFLPFKCPLNILCTSSRHINTIYTLISHPLRRLWPPLITFCLPLIPALFTLPEFHSSQMSLILSRNSLADPSRNLYYLFLLLLLLLTFKNYLKPLPRMRSTRIFIQSSSSSLRALFSHAFVRKFLVPGIPQNWACCLHPPTPFAFCTYYRDSVCIPHSGDANS